MPITATAAKPEIRKVIWNAPSASFELRSSSPEVIAHANTIFQPWQTANPPRPRFSWSIEKNPTSNSNKQLWEIRPGADFEVTRKDTLQQAVRCVEYLAIHALIMEPESPLSFHCALVAKDTQGVLILGPAQAGKSTLACALWLRGWSLLCDDLALVQTEQGFARPTPRRVSLREPSRDLLGETMWARLQTLPSSDITDEGIVFHPQEHDGSKQYRQVKLSAIVFLARRGSHIGTHELRRIDPAYALLAMAPYSNIAQHTGLGSALSTIQPLADRVPSFDLGRGELAKMVTQVCTLIKSDR